MTFKAGRPTRTGHDTAKPDFLAARLCGAGLLVSLPHPGPARLRRGPAPPAETLSRARHDCLVASDRVAFVVFGLWLLAGLTVALTLQFAAGGIPGRSAIHFVEPLTMCSAIAIGSTCGGTPPRS